MILFILPFGFILVLLNKVFPAKFPGRFTRMLCHYFGRMFCYVNSLFLPISIINKDEANKHKPCIVIANHQSFLDIFLFATQTCNDLSFMVKSWPFKVLFFFAPLMRAAEYVNVEQLSHDEIEARCLELLRSGTSLVIFPEGKRTRTGDLGRFRTGAFRLACAANVPIIPLIFENTYAIFPVGAKSFRPQRINITMLSAIYPKDFMNSDLAHRDMMRFAHKQYKDYFHDLKKGRLTCVN